jgi:hypothetical protein
VKQMNPYESDKAMATKTKAQSPRHGMDEKWRTTLNLDRFIMSRLKEVERRTGAPMSVTARRILRKALEAQQEA